MSHSTIAKNLRVSHTLWLLIVAGCALSAISSATGAAAQPKESRMSMALPLPLQLKIWQCRQRCYRQTLLEPTLPALCRSRPDCYMCHDYCRVLVIAEWSLATSMCADRIFCSRGCRTACKFHRLDPIGAAATRHLTTLDNTLPKGA